MTATEVWVEFYGGPWDGEMREMPGDENGRPTAVAFGPVGGPYTGIYYPGATLAEGVVRMGWHHLGHGPIEENT